ncbi:MAG: hypothetical protein V5A64_02970 [Candidatus Thermoplasmatota archaeon]
MNKSFKKLEKSEKSIFITQPETVEELIQRKKTALEVAEGKFRESGGKIETVMQTGEAFGRGLFEEYLKEDIEEMENCTLEDWVKPVVKKIFNPLGTGATFTNVSEDTIESIIFRYENVEEIDHEMETLFHYGFLRGLFRSVFPDGEISIESCMADGSPLDRFTFKAITSNKKIKEL